MGLLSPGSYWIIAATQCYIKWARGNSFEASSGAVVANFIRNNVICHFGIPKRLFSNNWTHYVYGCGINHVKSSPYYPQGMVRQKSLIQLHVLDKMVYQEPKWWVDFLSSSCDVSYLEAYLTPFSFVSQANYLIIMIEFYELEALVEMRRDGESKWLF